MISTWNLAQLNIEVCWQQGLNGTGVSIGHLDTGVDAQHPALWSKVTRFMAFDADGLAMPDVSPQDSGNHGTHTAGIICGGVVEGQAIGIAPGAQLCSGMVIEGGKPLLRVLCGLEWMLSQNVRVLCVSLGVPGYNRLFEIILGRLRQKSVLCVFPIGNSGRKVSCSPANYPGVIGVGAIARDGSIARFSGSQTFNRKHDPTKPNLVAPGVRILSAQAGGGLSLQDGTSMAAAHVAGVAALLFQAKPNATVEEVEQALLSSCLPLPGVDRALYGSGLVNPIGALEQLLGSPVIQIP